MLHASIRLKQDFVYSELLGEVCILNDITQCIHEPQTSLNIKGDCERRWGQVSCLRYESSPVEFSLLRGGVPASQSARGAPWGGLMSLITLPVWLCVSTNQGRKLATKLKESSFISVQERDSDQDGGLHLHPIQPVADTPYISRWIGRGSRRLENQNQNVNPNLPSASAMESFAKFGLVQGLFYWSTAGVALLELHAACGSVQDLQERHLSGKDCDRYMFLDSRWIENTLSFNSSLCVCYTSCVTTKIKIKIQVKFFVNRKCNHNL